MTAQEKAKELYDNYEFVYIQNYTSKHEVKNCALIAVNEIENALIDCAELSDSLQNMDRALNFWQNVRKEIEGI